MRARTNQHRDDLLVEIGTEELPPAALKSLALSFRDHLVSGLTDAGLIGPVETHWFATPRRLAVIIPGVAKKGEAQHTERRGPAEIGRAHV